MKEQSQEEAVELLLTSQVEEGITVMDPSLIAAALSALYLLVSSV